MLLYLPLIMLHQVKQYKNPPVKEAILTLSFRESISFSVIEKLCPNDNFDDRYKLISHVMTAEFEPINVNDKDEKITTQYKSRKDGIEMRSDAGDVLKINTTHLSLHLFQPYKGWEYMAHEFCKLWSKLQKSIPELKISEIRTRYINELKIPADGSIDLKKYIRLLPQKVEGIFEKINQFFLQIQMKDETGELRGVVTETMVPANSPSGLAILLDITASCQHLPMLHLDHCEQLLRRIRSYKNRMFEGAVTKEMFELFDTEN
jgi:uncharacterized protein (TIGR04255 family)